jgi:hypothetical protein
MHLPTLWTDRWRGAFHDSVSGAYLFYYVDGRGERAKRAAILTRPDDAIEEGQVGEHKYKLVQGFDARVRYERLYADGLGGPLGLAERMRRLLPGSTARFLRVVFPMQDGEWGFEAAPRTEDQSTRIRDLLLGAPRLWTEAEECDMAVRSGDDLSRDAYEQLQVGGTATSILDLAGPAAQVLPLGEDGFALEYNLRSKGRYAGLALLSFGRNQRLVDKQLDLGG